MSLLRLNPIKGWRLIQVRSLYYTALAPNRDVVGFGLNGRIYYADSAMFPFPSVRFRQNTAEIMKLREKEKEDWQQLSIDEKKTLYRHSFCQTFSEFRHPTGEWKAIIGWTLIISSLWFWMYIYQRKFILGPLPPTFDEDRLKAQLRRRLVNREGAAVGISSHWDYENDKWKDHWIMNMRRS